jgi:hypothetical protein
LVVYTGTSRTYVDTAQVSSVSFRDYSERTWAASVIRTVVVSMIVLPVFVRAVVPMKLNVVFSLNVEAYAVAPGADHRSLVRGVLVLLLGGAVFIVRNARKKGDSRPDKEPTSPRRATEPLAGPGEWNNPVEEGRLYV